MRGRKQEEARGKRGRNRQGIQVRRKDVGQQTANRIKVGEGFMPRHIHFFIQSVQNRCWRRRRVGERYYSFRGRSRTFVVLLQEISSFCFWCSRSRQLIKKGRKRVRVRTWVSVPIELRRLPHFALVAASPATAPKIRFGQV